MSLISISPIVDGTLAKAADVNDRVSAILKVMNGGIDATNIKAASITSPLLATNSIATANIQDGAVTREKLSSSITTITSNATITPDAQVYIVTALAENATVAPVSGTPYSAQPLLLRVTASGATRTLSWDTIYRGIGVTLPTSLTSGQKMYAAGRYNLEEAKWDIIGIGRS